MEQDIVIYIPIHSNFSQVEHTAAFLAHYKTKIFLYEWNTAKNKMAQYYANSVSAKTWKGVELFVFSIENLVHNLLEEKGKVVVLLTSSVNYTFGMVQQYFFNELKSQFPNVIQDVFSVGHCLYGCQSCGIKEHSIPVYFTRFKTNQLHYSTNDVRKLIDIQKQTKRFKHKKSSKKSVLICPSVGPLSYLMNDHIIDALVRAQEELDFVFMVKLHGFCYLEKHPLNGVTDIEQKNVEFLKKKFAVVDETQFNVLPMLEAFDIIITDVDSSVAFEALYFYPKTVLTYHPPSQPLEDQEYVKHLHTFTDPAQLTEMLTKLNNSTFKDDAAGNGRSFFESKYGVVDGKEVERIVALRGWNNPLPESKKNGVDAVSSEIYNAVVPAIYSGKFGEPVTGAHFLAIGVPVPNDVVQFDAFLRMHTPQLDTIGLPRHLWKKAYEIISGEVFSAGELFELHQDEEGLKLVSKVDIAPESTVVLVDHCWTTDYQHAKEQLRKVPGLLDRLYTIVNLDEEVEEEGEEEENDAEGQNPEEQHEEQEEGENETESKQEEDTQDLEYKVNRVWNAMWKYSQMYQVVNSANSQQAAVWYVMDEVGSGVRHSSEPNVRCMPILFIDRGIAFNLLWPINKIAAGDTVTRDFYPAASKSELERQAHLFAFFPNEIPTEPFKIAYQEHLQRISSTKRVADVEVANVVTPRNEKLKVYTDVDIIKEQLSKSDKFVLVGSEGDADILWYTTEFKFFNYLKPNQLVNQFPGEKAIVFKHLLPKTLQAYHSNVDWLPTTYDLVTQLPEFVGEYLERQEKGEDNYWLTKPWNMARSLDMCISDNISYLIRASETGPKIVTKYLSNPALYEKRKFDLRYCVLLNSLQPFEAYIYNFFWIRSSNHEYSLDNFEDYEKHFTVMNYSQFKLRELKCYEWTKEMENEHPNLKWPEVQQRINSMLRKTFEAAAASTGFGPCNVDNYESNEEKVVAEQRNRYHKQCRAMYGIDLMLDADFEPKLLEVNFLPDIKRACYDPQFCEKVFSTMFLHQIDPEIVTKL